MTELWSSALQAIRAKVSVQDYEAWFVPIGCDGVDEREIVLRVPHGLFADWIRARYGTLIEVEVSRQAGRPMLLRLVNAEDAATAPQGAPRGSGQVALFTPPGSDAPALPDGLMPKYNFRSFVVGPSNQFAHAACQAVADNPTSNYNPLFIYGGVGLGKTHLLHAIGIGVHERNPRARIRYISSENYINDLITSIRLERMDDFRYRYRNECDVLLIDDIQFFAGKDRTQEEFFHTFNSLHSAHKQIVVTSDRFPQEIPGLEERLRSRFQWGLIADIQPPEMETRVAILKKKAEKLGFDLADDVTMYLATAIKSNVRELEGSLTRLHAWFAIKREVVTLAKAKELLRNIIQDRGRVVTAETIMKVVAAAYDVKVSDLKGERRHRTVTRPRMVAMYLSRRLTNESFPEIGRRFGGRDHSTVISAVNKIEKELLHDTMLQKMVRDLERQLEM
ncbi:MAG: hypothetical protein AMXMBFR64_19170 [Myxococcales bacterium]